MISEEALNLFIKKCESLSLSRILNVGAGGAVYEDVHSNVMRSHGLHVSTNDIADGADFVGDYLSIKFENKFEGIWCSHVLEHMRNTGLFLDKIKEDLLEGGILAITVPPRKDQIVGGHITLWNAGTLLYNLILAGFDCSQAAVKSYGYNVSVIVRKKTICLPTLLSDYGDIEILSDFFPTGLNAEQNFNGVITELNWNI